MTSSEIADLFASYSEPDEYEVQAQLELFAWARRDKTARDRDNWRRVQRKPERMANLVEYRRRWREKNRAQQAAYRAANREKRNAYFRDRRAAKRAEQRAA